MYRSALKAEHDISIALTIYNTYIFPRTTQRKFQLRNLQDSTQEAQAQHAKQILQQVAEELYYITGFGIDKGVVKVGSKKFSETVYPDLTPKIDQVDFDALLFQFIRACTYAWAKDDEIKWAISEKEMAEGWQKIPKPVHSQQSFRLPVIALREEYKGYMGFFQRTYSLRRKRKRRSYGFSVAYNKEDPIFVRFMNRFQESGNLAFGERNYFNLANGYVNIEGRYWPASKKKSKKPPLRTKLASQPYGDTEFVYIIRAGRTNMYKIGKSNDPQARLETLQTANPHKLKLVHTFNADNAGAAEQELHNLLHNNRLEGEWFKIPLREKDILATIQKFEENLFWIDDQGIPPKQLLSLADN